MTSAIENLKEGVLEQFKIMRSMLIKEGEKFQFDPMVALRLPDGKLAAIVIPQFKECGDQLKFLIKQLVGHFAADRVYILAEAWIRKVDIDSTDRRKPSECEDREEALTVYALDRDTASLCTGYQTIERLTDGKAHFPHDPQITHDPSGTPAGGRFPSVRDLWDITDSNQSERLN